MNPLQTAIANALGIDESFKEAIEERDRQLESAQTEWQTRDHDRAEQIAEMEHAFEAVISDNRILQRTLEDLDYLNLFELGNQIREVLPGANSTKTLKRLRRMRHDNPIAKQSIKLIIRFTLGKGITWISKNQAIRDALMEFWKDEENQIVFTSEDAQKEFVDETATDGEKFFACFEAEKVAPFLKLAEVPLEEIKDIIYHPENRRVPVYYKRQYKPLRYDGNEERYEPEDKVRDKVRYYRDYRITDEKLQEIGNRIKIPQAKIAKDDSGKPIKMFHAYVNPLWTRSGRRGISELYSSREWIRIFREFMGDRAGINRAAMSIAYKRTVKGGPSAVAQVTGTLGGRPVGTNEEIGDEEVRQLTRPVTGAIYDRNEAQDLEWMRTDTGAANAKEDARMLLMIAGAGVSTNLHYYGEGGDANLATAQAMELPMVKNYEDWQSWFESVNMAIFSYVLRLAFGENIPFEDDTSDRVQEAVDAGGFKLIAGNGQQPASLKLDVKEPAKTSVEDVVSWDFPPIITKDVVKHMTAWAQLTQQVAPQNQVVHEEAIKGALTVLGVPNVDQLMDKIRAEEERVQAEKEMQRQQMMDAMAEGGVTGPEPQVGKNGKNGQPVPGFVKAGQGGDANTKRLAKGKPPFQQVGRVSADQRPGRS